jgi:hypothetical protein
LALLAALCVNVGCSFSRAALRRYVPDGISRSLCFKQLILNCALELNSFSVVLPFASTMAIVSV